MEKAEVQNSPKSEKDQKFEKTDLVLKNLLTTPEIKHMNQEQIYSDKDIARPVLTTANHKQESNH